MNTQMKEILRLYRQFSLVPNPVSAVLRLYQDSDEDMAELITVWNLRDLDRSEKTSFIKQYTGSPSATGGGLKFSTSSICVDCTQTKLSAFSPGPLQLRALVTQRPSLPKDPIATPSDYLEIWDGESKRQVFNLKELDLHGPVNTDGQFGSLEWSRTETKLVYLAEAKIPKTRSYFKKLADDSKEESTPGAEYVYEDDWGESLVDKKHPVPCVADLQSESISIITSGLPPHTSAGQVIWGPDDNTLVCVGWPEEPRRLGLTYCTNRRSHLYCLNLQDGTCSALGYSDNQNVRSPRFSPDYRSLIYLENPAGGPHRSCSQLMKIDWESRISSVVVDIVENADADDVFPGLYVEKLPKNCFSKDGEWIVLPSQWRSKVELLAIHLVRGTVVRLTNDADIGAWNVLDVKEDYIVAAASSLNMKPHLRVGKLKVEGQTIAVDHWTIVGQDHPTIIANVDWDLIQLRPAPDQMAYEAIHVKYNGTDKPKPLIVWPHGGPHSAFSCGYQLYTTVFACLGFDMLLVNYRGSLGYGNSNVFSLLGKVGQQDVADVVFAVKSLQSKHKFNHLLLFGGSHGGFLSAHLTGQFPDMFEVSAIRNPVIDISCMIGKSDIPDWSMVECGMSYDFTTVPDPSQLTVLWNSSPIRYIKQVKAPTLLLIGKKDRRVPPSQGLKFYNVLKAMGVTTKLLLYDDNHSLSNVEVEADVFVNVVAWFMKHLDL